MRILPAIDLYNNHCVRLTEGRYESIVEYDSDPVEAAKRFIDSGFTSLHIVDLEGAKIGRVIHSELIRRIIALSGVQAHVGGGIRTDEDVRSLIDAGVSRVITGSVAVQSPETLKHWIDQYGSERFCVAVDVRNEKVVTAAWQQNEELLPDEVIRFGLGMRIYDFLCTDVSRDGKLEGPNVKLYESLNNRFPQIRLIASGGVSSIQDLHNLKETGVSAAIVGKALYENKIKLDDLQQFLRSQAGK